MHPKDPDRYVPPAASPAASGSPRNADPAPHARREPHASAGSASAAGVIYQTQVECPVCGARVGVPKVAQSKLRPVRHHADLYTEFRGVDPNRYWVWVCSACGYSAASTSWPDRAELDLDLARSGVARLGLRRDIGLDRSLEDARAAFDQAVACAVWRRHPRGYLATLHHRRAWLERSAGDPAAERKALASALECYREAFETEPRLPGNLDESAACHVLAELFHRLGSYAEAVPWYARAVASGGGGRPWLVRLARDRWSEARQAAAGRRPAGGPGGHAPGG